jgi:hypothetical protein
VIFAVIDSLDDVPPLVGGLELALAADAPAMARTTAVALTMTSLRTVTSLVVN